jgi:predicted RNA-binding Zn-ribbon protein involved in translation (DUF1610 family)
MKTILKQLDTARDFVRLGQPDRNTLVEIVAGCVKVLQQSPRDYSAWSARHRDAIRKLNRAAIIDLISLTISDVSACRYDYPPVWQFEQFATRSIIAKATKSAKACVCATCNKTFHPERRVKYCSPRCGNRAKYRAHIVRV